MLRICLFAVFLGSLAAQEQAAPALVNLPADLDGKAIPPIKGRLVVLEWLDLQCPCTGTHYRAGALQKVQQRALASGVVWITLFSETPAVCQSPAFLTTIRDTMQGWQARPSRLATDPGAALARRFAVTHAPTVVVLSETGSVAYHGVIDSSTLQGEKPDTDYAAATNFVEQALEDLRAKRPVRLAKTPALGCLLRGLAPP